MTEPNVRVRPRWMRRIKAAWRTLTLPKAQFDNQLAAFHAKRQRTALEADVAQVARDVGKSKTPIADELALFGAIKEALASIVVEHRHKELPAGEIIVRIRQMLAALGYAWPDQQRSA